MPDFQPPQPEQRSQEIQDTTLSWRNALIATLLNTLEKWADLYVKRIDTKDSIDATRPEFNLFLKEFTLLFMVSKKLMPDELQKRVLADLSDLNHMVKESREDGMALTMEIQHHLEEKGIVPLVMTLPQPAFVLEALHHQGPPKPPPQPAPMLTEHARLIDSL